MSINDDSSIIEELPHNAPPEFRDIIKHPLERRVTNCAERKQSASIGHVFQSDCTWIEPYPEDPRRCRQPMFEDLKVGSEVLALAPRNVLPTDNRPFRVLRKIDSQMIYYCQVENVFPETRRIRWRYMCLNNNAYTNGFYNYIAYGKASKAKSWFPGDALDVAFNPSEILVYWHRSEGCFAFSDEAIPYKHFTGLQRILKNRVR
jgi:hypothetical protein